METKNASRWLEGLRRKVGMFEGVYIELGGLSGGLALWWNHQIQLQVLRKDKHMVDSVVSGRWRYGGSHYLATCKL